MPPDAYQRAKFDRYKQCMYRFIGEAQVSPIDYSDPSFIPAHVFVFDCGTFGVLFLTIRSMSLYSGINENFGAVNFFMNVLQIYQSLIKTNISGYFWLGTFFFILADVKVLDGFIYRNFYIFQM